MACFSSLSLMNMVGFLGSQLDTDFTMRWDTSMLKQEGIIKICGHLIASTAIVDVCSCDE